jgi:hypothetical protein
MEKLGFSKRILEMNFMKNSMKKKNNQNKKEINNDQWEISLPQIENFVDQTIDKFYNKRKKIINDTILKNSRIKSQKKKKNDEQSKKKINPK